MVQHKQTTAKPDETEQAAECRPAHFKAVQRHVSLYLRALWGSWFALAELDEAQRLPVIEQDIIYFPPWFRPVNGQTGAAVYRAAAAHAAAHLIFSNGAIAIGELNPRQMALIALIEDARVEHLAIKAFPGLARLWRFLHPAVDEDNTYFSGLLARLSRALIDPDYRDDNHWVQKGVRLFHACGDRLEKAEISRDIGLRLAHDLGQMRIAMDSESAPVIAPYRDDNRHLWIDERNMRGTDSTAGTDRFSLDQGCRFQEREQGMRFAASEQPDPHSSLSGLLLHKVDDDAPLEYREEAVGRKKDKWVYPEWDYRIALMRRRWCIVCDTEALPGEAAGVDAVLTKHATTVQRLRRLGETLRRRGLQRVRRQLLGDELDLDAAIRALTDLRSGDEPDLRVYFDSRRQAEQSLAVLVLLDLSESTNDAVPGTGTSVLGLTREATVLLAHTLEALGEVFAIHGFSSNGRKDVRYRRFKGFHEPYGEQCRARIAGMSGEFSTRMGAALRHAGECLVAQRAERKLLLVITDGEPSDIDVYDSEYLGHDARRAVNQLHCSGIQSYCLSLDVRGEAWVARIFGRGRYAVLNNMARLPDVLPQIYLGLTRGAGRIRPV